MQGKPIIYVHILEERNKSGADIAQLKSTSAISLTALEEKTDALNEQQQRALSMHHMLDDYIRGKRRGITETQSGDEYIFINHNMQ